MHIKEYFTHFYNDDIIGVFLLTYSKICGVLPITYANQKSYKTSKFREETSLAYGYAFEYDSLYVQSTLGKGFNILLLLIFAIFSVKCMGVFIVPCYKMNDCMGILINILHMPLAACLVTIAIFRGNAVIHCLNSAKDIESISICCKNLKSLINTNCYCILLTVLIIVRMIVRLKFEWNGYTIGPLLYNFSFIVPILLECVIIQLCIFVEKHLHNINVLFNEKGENKKTQVTIALKIKKHIYIFQNIVNLMHNISRCFGLELLLNLVFNMFWFIIIIYLDVEAIQENYVSGKTAVYTTEVILLCCRVFYMSWRVHRIELQVHAIKISLRNLYAAVELNKRCRILVNHFINQVDRSNIELDVCSVFSVNLSFLRAVVGLATTYFIVFIQNTISEPDVTIANNLTTITIATIKQLTTTDYVSSS